eukprot:TRINITY_DN8699_c0_g1_i1.p1 TRINITY_DN8699_c0_g1~~TRINITY_DN8699_c0_g1_i1.p1  ORF type:complete len:265 (+),score=69.08 TRINITY_DN8699_c0_g1_i1:399-1193(+)
MALNIASLLSTDVSYDGSNDSLFGANTAVPSPPDLTNESDDSNYEASSPEKEKEKPKRGRGRPAKSKGSEKRPKQSDSTAAQTTTTTLPRRTRLPLTDEQLQKLKELRRLRDNMDVLQKVKTSILSENERLKMEDDLLEEFAKEKELLVAERRKKMEDLQIIQQDLTLIETTMANKRVEREQIRKHIESLTEDFSPLKDSVNQMRSALGLPPLPSLQEEQEKHMNSYLESRRMRWQEEISKPTSATTTTSTSSSSSRRRRNTRT